jgi:hypothetical protein
MGYKKLSNLTAQLLGLLKTGDWNKISSTDKEKLINDIVKELL